MTPTDADPGLLELAAAWQAARSARDPRGLAALCDRDPSIVMFEDSGHTYRGAAHWSRRPLPADPGESEVVVAVRRGSAGWIVLEDRDGAGRPMRTTLAAIADGDGWRLAHLHSSPVSSLPRPGGI